MAWRYLTVLWLGNNYFSGQIPSSMGYLKGLQSLHLQNNRLFGPLPQSLQNCSLVTLDLSVNSFTGKLPTWIGKFHDTMKFLKLRSNMLEGEIPIELCYLILLQVLDIAQNNFSGRIPTCFKNLTAMTFSQRFNLDEQLGGDSIWFYLGMPWGFVVGFWCVIGPLLVKKSWRLVYFRFLDHTWEKFSIVTLE
ncbi:Leucine-rich repeat, partial [Dillenia turbinata]